MIKPRPDALVAAVDMGTQSVILTVARRTAERLQPLLDKVEPVRLGADWSAGEPLAPKALDRLRDALTRFRSVLARTGAHLEEVAATEIARSCARPHELTTVVEQILDRPLRVLSGEEEALLARRAVEHAYPGHQRLAVLDLGGGSLEIDAGRRRGSLPLGASRMEREFRNRPAQQIGEHTTAALREAGWKKGTLRGRPLAAVGGPATSLPALELALVDFEPDRIEGHPIDPALCGRWIERLERLAPALRARLPGMPPGRADTLPAGLRVLQATLLHLNPAETFACTWGLRHGLLLPL